MKKSTKTNFCGRSINTGRCTDIIDAGPDEVCAYLYDFCSHDRLRISKEEGNPVRLILTNDGRQQLVATVKRVQWPLYDREFVFRTFWWKDEADGSHYVGVVSVDENVDYGTSMKTTRGSTINLTKLIPFGEVGADGKQHQSQMIYTQKRDGAGFLPEWLVNSVVQNSLNAVQSTRLAFNRDTEIDKAENARLINIMQNSNEEVYDAVENDALRSAKEKFDSIGKLDPIESTSHRVQIWGGHIEGDPMVVGVGEVLVDCSIEECAANEYFSHGRVALNIFYDLDGGMIKEFHHFNSHSLRNRSVYYVAPGGALHY